MNLYKVTTRDDATFFVHAIDRVMALIAVDQLSEIKQKHDVAIRAHRADGVTVMRPL